MMAVKGLGVTRVYLTLTYALKPGCSCTVTRKQTFTLYSALNTPVAYSLQSPCDKRNITQSTVLNESKMQP
jgi:hypothetical protein